MTRIIRQTLFSAHFLRNAIFVGLQFLVLIRVSGQTVDSLQTQLRIARHDSTRLRIYSKLVEWYYWNSQYDSMQGYNQKVLALSRRYYANPLNEYSASYYHRLGLYYRAKGLFDKSLQALYKAVQICHQINDQSRISKIRYALSVVYADRGDTRQAIAQSLTNLAYYEKQKSPDMMLNTYTVLVDLYEKLEDRKLSHFYMDQYLRLVKKTHDVQKLFVGYALKADLYKEQADYARERPYRELSLKLARQLKQPDQLVYALNEMGTNLRKNYQPRLAIHYLKEALQVSDQMSEGKSYVVSATRQELARAELELGHTGAALQEAQLALASARVGGRPTDIAEASATLAMAQELNGNYREALRTYKEHQAMADSLFNLKKNEQIAQVQARYDLEKKESTILLLNKNAQLQRLKAAEQEQQRLMLMLGIAILVLVVGIISYFLRRYYLTQKVLTRQKQEIETQAVALIASNSMKDRIFSILSHDLRSPVASLKASFTLLKIKNRLPSELNGLEREVNGLSYTLDNILYWALMQQNGLRIRPQQVALNDLVDDVLDSFTGLVQSKQLIVTFDPVSADCWVDENLILVVLRNVLHNAIKFTPPGGAIRISILREPAQTKLRIADTGVGMDLTRRDLDQPAREQGTGLGLGLSEELMRLIGGQLTIESQPGQGTTVTLSCPTTTVPN